MSQYSFGLNSAFTPYKLVSTISDEKIQKPFKIQRVNNWIPHYEEKINYYNTIADEILNLKLSTSQREPKRYIK